MGRKGVRVLERLRQKGVWREYEIDMVDGNEMGTRRIWQEVLLSILYACRHQDPGSKSLRPTNEGAGETECKPQASNCKPQVSSIKPHGRRFSPCQRVSTSFGRMLLSLEERACNGTCCKLLL